MHLNFYYEKCGIPGQKNWSIDIRTFHSLSPPRWRHTHCCSWIYDTSKLIFHLLICSLSVVWWICCCLAVYSPPPLQRVQSCPLLLTEPQMSLLALPLVFSSFLPSYHRNIPCRMNSQCNDEKSIHSVSSEQWYLNLDIWKSYYRVFAAFSVLDNIFVPPGYCTGSITRHSLVLYCGKCATNRHGGRLWR